VIALSRATPLAAPGLLQVTARSGSGSPTDNYTLHELLDWIELELWHHSTPEYIGTDTPGARGLSLTKEDGTVYNLELDGGWLNCHCKGHTNHSRCKHADALAELIAKGRLCSGRTGDAHTGITVAESKSSLFGRSAK